jgi:hypothetical protein
VKFQKFQLAFLLLLVPFLFLIPIIPGIPPVAVIPAVAALPAVAWTFFLFVYPIAVFTGISAVCKKNQVEI